MKNNEIDSIFCIESEYTSNKNVTNLLTKENFIRKLPYVIHRNWVSSVLPKFKKWIKFSSVLKVSLFVPNLFLILWIKNQICIKECLLLKTGQITSNKNVTNLLTKENFIRKLAYVIHKNWFSSLLQNFKKRFKFSGVLKVSLFVPNSFLILYIYSNLIIGYWFSNLYATVNFWVLVLVTSKITSA